MISVAVGAITCIAILLTRVLFVWQRNFKIAKTAEFPTFHSPFHTDDLWWLAIQERIAPYFEKLPTTWTRPWLPFARIWKLWHVGYQPFAEVGSDTLLLASPSGNTLWTCDNKIAKQIYSLPTVQTPVKSMEFLNIWGPTIATVEGQEWKIHRKAVTNGFNPSTYDLVWEEAIFQIEELIKYWGENDDFTVSNIRPWAIRVALHVLSSALFNRRLQWKDQSLQGSDKKQSSDRLNFPDALTTVVSRVGLILVTPRILFRLPVKGLQKVGQALEDLTFYMDSMRSRTIERSQEIISHPRMSLLESIVLAGMPEYTASHSSSSSLSKEGVMGNIFVTLLAGHDTTGNTLTFIILLLAVYPEYQKDIQSQLSEVLGNRSSDQWNYEDDYPELYKGILGAVLKEVLRLYCVIEMGIRKTTVPTKITDSSGKQHIIPSNTTCITSFSAATQNPSRWPRAKVSDEYRRKLHNSHAVDFDPKRWLEVDNPMTDDSFWPFAAGYRKCPGRHFAQVSIIAATAKLLKNHSIRLVVDEKTLVAHGRNADQAWKAVRERAMCSLEDDIEVNLNVFMNGSIPLEIVPRV